MVLHVFISLLGGVPLCIPYGLYSGTSLGGTTRGTLEGYPGRVLSQVPLVLVQYSRTRNLEIRHHFLRDHARKGDISLEFSRKEDQLADILTKPLNEEQFVNI